MVERCEGENTMNRIIVLLIFALAGAVASAQPDFSKVEVRTERLSPGTWMLAGAGGNLAPGVGDDAVFVIDSEYAALAPKVKEAIAKITTKPVQFVLNTHFHFDMPAATRRAAATAR
jgi:glyoxylase-like metal-dependent hydrolase (beta-lactamase superfamily II)